MKRPFVALNFDLLDESGIDSVPSSPVAKRRRRSSSPPPPCPMFPDDLYRVFILNHEVCPSQRAQLPELVNPLHAIPRPIAYAYRIESAHASLKLDEFLDTLVIHAASEDYRVCPASSPAGRDGSWPIKLVLDWLVGYGFLTTAPRVVPPEIAKSTHAQRGVWNVVMSTYGKVTGLLDCGQAASELHFIQYDDDVVHHQLSVEITAQSIAAATRAVAKGISPNPSSIPPTLEHISLSD